MTSPPPYELTGPNDAPLIIALGGISASRHVTANENDATPGWWESVVGPDRAIDTLRFRVLGIDYIDGGCGSGRRPARTITTHEQADALALLLDTLDVKRAHTIVGASYGGMVALAFGERYADRVEQLVVISAPHRPHPMSTAMRSLQRRVVALGIDTGETREALALARGLAMTTYRSAREFAERFETAPLATTVNDAVFPVDGYLRHHGERFADTWRPERFLALSLSADLHCVDPGAIVVPTLLIAAEGDTIVPVEQMRELAHRLGAPVEFAELASSHGHDAFLTEPDALGHLLSTALTTCEHS